MPNPFARPSVETKSPLDPMRREENLLKRAAKGPAGRWAVAAMLALSSQGCASFKIGGISLADREAQYPGYNEEPSEEDEARMAKEVRSDEARTTSPTRAGKRPTLTAGGFAEAVSAAATGEGRMTRGFEFMSGVKAGHEGGAATIGIKPKTEHPGMRQWWRWEEGVYDPDESAYKRAVKNEDRAEIRRFMKRDRQLRLKEMKTKPIDPKVTRLTFFEGERRPTALISVVHERPGETRASMLDRGFLMMAPALSPYEGVRVEWHTPIRGPEDSKVRLLLMAFERPDIPPDSDAYGFEDSILHDAVSSGVTGAFIPEAAEGGTAGQPLHLAIVKHLPDPPAYSAQPKRNLPKRPAPVKVLTPEEGAYQNLFMEIAPLLTGSEGARLYPMRDEGGKGYVMVTVIDRPTLPQKKAIPRQ